MAGIVHLLYHYPIICQTPKEDYFKLCQDAGGGTILPVSRSSRLKILKSITGRTVHAQGRGFPFPELASLFARKSVYSPHNDTLGTKWYTRTARRFVFNRYDRIISETRYGREILIAQGINPRKIAVLPIPVDYGFFSRPHGAAAFRKKHKLGRKPFALAIGMRPVKNPDVIAEACSEAGIKAVFIGPRSAQEAEAAWGSKGFDWFLPGKKLAGYDNAVFPGQLGASETLAAMDAASVFLNSSDYESFGLAVYEAAAAGLNLCLPDYGTFDSFRHCALFHHPRDASALAKNITKSLERSGKKNRKAQAVAAKFDYPKVFRMYKKFYSNL